MRDSRPILLVEDDMVDAMAVRRAVRDLKLENSLVHRSNGEEALEYLNESAGSQPCLILLDLNMPRMNGFEFLDVLKASDRHRKIPVTILTTSSERGDIERSFDLGAAGYMVKSIDYASFLETMRAVHRYWAVSEIPACAQAEGTAHTCAATDGTRGVRE